jgi:hypothetical protein
MQLQVITAIADLSFGFAIKDRRGTVLWGITNVTANGAAQKAATGDAFDVIVPIEMWLSAGEYFVTLGAAHLESGQKIDFVEDAFGFQVLGPANTFTTSVVNLNAQFFVNEAPPQQTRHLLSAELAHLAGDHYADLCAALRLGLNKEASEFDRYLASEKITALLYPKYRFSEFSRLCLEDEHFTAGYTKFMDANNWHSFDRKYTLYQMLHLTHHLRGDLVECGAYRGGSAYFMCEAHRDTGRTIHLFDSFSGLSEPRDIDGAYWRRGALATSQDTLTAGLAGFTNYRCYAGWIPTRFVEVENLLFSFLHIDVDLYEPTKDSLEFFYPRMLREGVILMDDYGFKSCPGAKQAADEFFADKPEKIVMLPTGQAFVIKQ